MILKPSHFGKAVEQKAHAILARYGELLGDGYNLTSREAVEQAIAEIHASRSQTNVSPTVRRRRKGCNCTADIQADTLS